ncbi:helix-turn-helix domain-containing protein [Schinkia azotoformans]|uniref:helix-turn-helix domain-containing protein n=1 Tax=Schinkia azotoformans TaxID=1454 RepID=UPI002E1E7488|nr:helix-turn-helix domain-containing protein [Schinkia azotoformans]
MEKITSGSPNHIDISEDLMENYFESKAVQELLDISESTLSEWHKKGLFPDTKNINGILFVLKNTVLSIKGILDNEKDMLSIKDVSNRLGITIDKTRVLLRKYIQNAFKGKMLLISKENLEKFLDENGWLIPYYQDGTIPSGYFSTKMIADYFKIKPNKAAHWIRQGRFEGVRKIGENSFTNTFIVPESSIYTYERFVGNLNDNYVTAKEASEILGVCTSTVGNFIQEGTFKDTILWFRKMYIPYEEVKRIKQELTQQNKMKTIHQAAKQLGVSKNTIQKCVDLKLFNGTIIDNMLYIESKVLESLPDNFFEDLHAKGIIITKHIQKPKDYLTTREVADKLNITIQAVGRLIKNGELGTPIKCFENGIKINAINIELFEKYLIKHENRKNCLDTKNAAIYLGEISQSTVVDYIKKGYFPNAFMENRKYLIPLDDIDEFIKIKNIDPTIKKMKKKTKIKKEVKTNNTTQYIKLSKPELIDDIINTIQNEKIPQYLDATKEHYIKFVSIRISSLNGHKSYIISECSRAKNCFKSIILNLPKECFELSDEIIQEILLNNSLALSHRTLANWFFQYVFGVLGMNNRKDFRISPVPVDNDDGKEIYSPEIYLEYLSYTKNVDQHISGAIRSQFYANMWLYTIMHLMDTWRATDIVNNLLNIDLEVLNIDSFEWFLKNKLSTEQAQIVINQVYISTRNLTTSKTNALLTFLVPMDFILPAGNAFIICELHRRQSDDKYLLQTLISQNLNAKLPNKKHLNFFRFNTILQDFRSRVMNRSTMTYLFNSIVDDAPDPELALTYTQLTRSHEKEQSTAVYVKATNFDGSLGNVSLNLFNRGHFGWLYNTIIKLMFEETNTSLSIDTRTQLIMALRNEFNPVELENWGTFLLSLNKKRESLFNVLITLDKRELKLLILKIFNGDMPCRDGNGQCLTYPHCEKRNLKSCSSCEFHIPQVYAIIHMKQEIEHLIKSLNTTKYETIIERDAYILKIYLLILNEAISVYGQDYINTFIDLNNIRKQVIELSPVLLK